jgi:hypothetical protein
MVRAHGSAGAADGQEPEWCERMEAQEQLMGRSPNGASAWKRRSSQLAAGLLADESQAGMPCIRIHRTKP